MITAGDKVIAEIDGAWKQGIVIEVRSTFALVELEEFDGLLIRIRRPLDELKPVGE